MIRLLTTTELPILIEGGREFFAEGDMPGGFEADHFLDTSARLMADGVGFIAGSFGDDGIIHGALAWVLAPGLFSRALIATETFWFMRPEYRGRNTEGVRLFNFFETSAKTAGAKWLAMIFLHALQPVKLAKFYQRRGYKLVESHYVREAA